MEFGTSWGQRASRGCAPSVARSLQGSHETGLPAAPAASRFSDHVRREPGLPSQLVPPGEGTHRVSTSVTSGGQNALRVRCILLSGLAPHAHARRMITILRPETLARAGSHSGAGGRPGPSRQVPQGLGDGARPIRPAPLGPLGHAWADTVTMRCVMGTAPAMPLRTLSWLDIVIASSSGSRSLGSPPSQVSSNATPA